MGELKPNEMRLKVMRAVVAGQVFTYGWSTQAWWLRGLADEVPVVRWVNALRRAELVDLPKPATSGDRVWLRPTDAGREWLARHDGPVPDPPDDGQGVFATRRSTDLPAWQTDVQPAPVRCEPEPLTDPALEDR